MSKGSVFRNSASLGGDKDYMNCLNNQNDRFSSYQLANLRPSNNYVQSMGEVGLYHGQSNTVRPSNVDVESHLKNGDNGNVLTNNKDHAEKTLDTRLYASMPFTGPGSGTVKMDLEDEIKRSKMTNIRRSESEQRFVNTFIPLIPEMERAMGNVDHFVESKWTRGGISTRSVKQNTDYAKSCGLRR